MLKIYNIQSRRYIGSKTKLIKSINDQVSSNKKDIIFDLFAGTGVVANHFISLGYKVKVNDLLFSNFVSYQAFFGNGIISEEKLKKLIMKWNDINPNSIKNNYFSLNFGKKYFSISISKKIGYIRQEIDDLFANNKINIQEKYILITSLMYSMDKFANTVGHYEMYLKNIIPSQKDMEMGMINLINRDKGVEIFNENANRISKHEKADIYYLDPPYNARQYINFYHIWENIAKWTKPKLKWESLKFDRTGLKSKYSQKSAPQAMSKLFENIKQSKMIIVSYNNTYNASSLASNNKISEYQMKTIFSQKRLLKIKSINYRHFNSGKTNFKNHKEYLYISTI